MKKRRRQNHETAGDWILLHGMVAAVCLLLYPSVMDCLAYINQTSVIGTYQETVDELTEKEIEEQEEKVTAYNEILYQSQQTTGFSYSGEQYNDSLYDSLLNLNDKEKDRIMGYLEIPSIHVYLPIAHGTKSESLRYELGHIYGTSLPLPTGNTRAVIAGHTGLKEALLFTNLTKLEKGNLFYVHILGKKYTYQVSRIEVVTPEEADQYLQIEEGANQVTLFTCTPYGINDHRLLVTGDYMGEEAGVVSDEQLTYRKNMKYKVLLMILLCIPAGLMAAGSWWLRRDK